jgi:hypothetical protein
MGDDPAFTHARLSLSVLIQAVFTDAKVLDARDWEIRAGFSHYANQPLPPRGVKDVARAQRLGIMSKFVSIVQKAPAVTADGEGRVTSLRFFTSEDQVTPDKIIVTPAFFLKRRADLVWDDAAELIASEFPYTNVATRLTASVRRQVYGQSLADVKPPKEDSNTGFFDDGSRFFAAASTRATYDTDATGEPYYPKWLAPNPVGPKDRQFGFDALSDRYLELNFRPYDLEKGFVYLYLEVGRMLVLLKLMRDSKLNLQYEAVLGQGVPEVGDYFDIVNKYIADQRAKNIKLQATAVFVFSLEGTTAPPKFTQQQSAAGGGIMLNVMEQVVDPQAVVQDARGLAIDAIDKAQQRWTSRDWLREMVRLRFSEQWVWFWKNAYIEMYYQIDRDKLFLNELRAAQKVAVGPLRRTIDDLIKAANADPNLYLVKRGTKYGPDKRVMGSDGSYVYFYDNRTRLVTRLPMFVFWRDQNVSQISQVIYDSTKGMVPVIKAVVWTSTFVMAWGVIGTEALVQGFREYVGEYIADKISGAAIQKLITETFKRFRLRIMALLILPVLDLLGRKIFGETTAGRKTFAFLEGFAEGFTEHAFQAIIRRWESVINLEPAAYRTVKLLMRIEGILRWVDEKMSALKAYITENVAKALTNRFVDAAVEAGTALIALIDNLYFLDYKRAKGFLELYAEIAETRVPSEQEWDSWRHRHFLETFRYYKEEIESTGKDIADTYNDVQGAVQTAMKVVKVTEYAVGAVALTNIALAGGLVPLMLLTLKKVATKVGALAATKPGKIVTVGAGTTAAGGFVAALLLKDDFAKDVAEFAGGFGKAASALGSGAAATADFTWATPERMRRFGQILGVIVASVVISRAVIKRGQWQERWKQSKGAKGVAKFWGKETLRQQFNINPLLPGLKLVLFHYVEMVREVITDSDTAWDEFQDKAAAILLGENDPTLAGIVEEDKGITLPKLIDIMKLADALLLKWLKQLASTPGLTAEISAIAEKLKTITPSQLPPLDELTNDPTEWAREAVMYIVLTHLQGGLNMLIHSLQSMLEPIDPKDPNPVSVGFVLQTLGFNLQEADALDALDRNFDAAFEA